LFAPLLAVVLAGAAFTCAAADPREAAVTQAARDALTESADRQGLLNPQVEVMVVSAPSAPPDRPCARPEVEAVDTRFATRMRFSVRCGSDDPKPASYVVRGKVTAEVVVAAQSIATGRPIAAADLMLDRRDVTSTPDSISDMDAAIGQTSMRPLRPTQVVQKRLLTSPILLKRGQLVQIEVHSGPVQVSSSGEALEPGRAGDIVRVRNIASGKVIRARVTEDGNVQPADMPSTP
jgi:flagella basal body P-ring formation protein FlgA